MTPEIQEYLDKLDYEGKTSTTCVCYMKVRSNSNRFSYPIYEEWPVKTYYERQIDGANFMKIVGENIFFRQNNTSWFYLRVRDNKIVEWNY